jgi:hypothetical protein
MLGLNDLDNFLSDFGVPVVLHGISIKGIFDIPTNVVGEGMVLTNDYIVTIKTPSAGIPVFGTAITVNGLAYTVRDARMVDDGLFCEVLVSKT